MDQELKVGGIKFGYLKKYYYICKKKHNMPPEDYYKRKFNKIVESYLVLMSDLDKVKNLDRKRTVKYLSLSAIDYVNKYPN